jgi:hypothetical protein
MPAHPRPTFAEAPVVSEARERVENQVLLVGNHVDHEASELHRHASWMWIDEVVVTVIDVVVPIRAPPFLSPVRMMRPRRECAADVSLSSLR